MHTENEQLIDLGDAVIETKGLNQIGKVDPAGNFRPAMDGLDSED